MTANLEAVNAGANVVGVVNYPCGQPENLAFQLCQHLQLRRCQSGCAAGKRWLTGCPARCCRFGTQSTGAHRVILAAGGGRYGLRNHGKLK